MGVLGKLKQMASPVTESMDPLFVHRIIDTLFPSMEDGLNDLIPERETGWDEEEIHVTRGELRDVIRKIKSGKAPGPDGVPGSIWRLAHAELQEDLRDL